jgi:hypothetical protein
MAVAAKTIAAGKLGTALATLYTVPASKAARVTQIVYGNTDTSNSYSADLKLQPASLGISTSHCLIGAGTLIIASGSVETPSNGLSLMMAVGDKLQGNASAANVIDYVVSGLIEDA